MAEQETDKLELIDQTRDALIRVQEFDPGKMIREADLGKKFAMREAVAPAKRVIELFKLISPAQLEFFPDAQLTVIRDQANAFYSLLEEVSNFDVEEASPNPSDAKDALVARLEQQFQPVFDVLFPLVSFANIRSLDFAKLERDARAATQAAKDSVSAALSEIETGKQNVEILVSETRALAAEQGVSKQAIHFKTEADNHKTEADNWRRYTIYTAIGLAAYARASANLSTALNLAAIAVPVEAERPQTLKQMSDVQLRQAAAGARPAIKAWGEYIAASSSARAPWSLETGQMLSLAEGAGKGAYECYRRLGAYVEGEYVPPGWWNYLREMAAKPCDGFRHKIRDAEFDKRAEIVLRVMTDELRKDSDQFVPGMKHAPFD